MNITLSHDEIRLINSLLEKEMSSLHTEIHKAWNRDFKTMLKARRDLVWSLQNRLMVVDEARSENEWATIA